jgi:hypothetical protein
MKLKIYKGVERIIDRHKIVLFMARMSVSELARILDRFEVTGKG